MSSTHYLEYNELDSDAFGDGTETVVPMRYNKNALNPISIKQVEENLVLIAHDGNFIIYFLIQKWNLKSNNFQIPSSLPI